MTNNSKIQLNTVVIFGGESILTYNDGHNNINVFQDMNPANDNVNIALIERVINNAELLYSKDITDNYTNHVLRVSPNDYELFEVEEGIEDVALDYHLLEEYDAKDGEIYITVNTSEHHYGFGLTLQLIAEKISGKYAIPYSLQV